MSQDQGASLSATGLSPTVEPASSLAGSAASIPSAGEPWLSYAEQASICYRDYGPETAAEFIRDVVRMHGGALAETLQRIYDAEINVKIETFWDAGYDISLDGNSYYVPERWKHQWNVERAHEIEPWLRQAFYRFCAPASAMSAEGQDPQGLGAKPASAAPQEDAQ